MRKARGIAALLVAAPMLLVACGARAAWVRSNPGAGGAFSQASADGDTVWVGGDISGFYRTLDGGRSWTAIGFATPVSASAVAVKPRDGRRVVAGTDGSSTGNPFRVSTDAAAEVPRWSAPKAENGWPNYITWGIGPRVWAVGRSSFSKTGGPRLWESTNDGESWKTVAGEGLDGSACPIKIVCHPTQDDVLYLVSGRDLFKRDARKALYKSTDEGRHWTEIGAAELGGTIQDMALDPSSPSTLYATTGEEGRDRDQVYRSTDAGASWQAIGRKHTGNIVIVRGGVRLINVERPAKGESCGPRSECGTWEWNGKEWLHLSDTSGWETGWPRTVAWAYGTNAYGRAKTIAQDPTRPERLWWVNSRFVLVSDDGGVTFRSSAFTRSGPDTTFASRGLENVGVMSLDGHGPNMVAGYYDSGLWVRAVPREEAWRAINDPVAVSYVSIERDTLRHGNHGWDGAGGNASTCLHLEVDGRYKLWAANGENRDHQVFEWSDEAGPPGGHVWRRAVGLPVNVFISGLSFDPHSPPSRLTMFVTADGYVYKSVDDGHSWKKCEPGPYRVHFTAVDPANGRHVYAGGRSGFWLSEDGGATWSQPSGHGFQLQAHQITQGACSSDTSLGKMCWNGIHDLWAAPRGEVWAAFYRESPGGPDPGGLYVSTDGGHTWTCRIAKPYMQCVTGGAPEPNDVWAGQSKLTNASRNGLAGACGLYRSRDGGKKWEPVDLGISADAVSRLAVHGREVWAAVPGQGVYYLPAGGR